MTKAERDVIEAAQRLKEAYLDQGPHADDTIDARDELFCRLSRLQTERESAYWREVGT